MKKKSSDDNLCNSNEKFIISETNNEIFNDIKIIYKNKEFNSIINKIYKDIKDYEENPLKSNYPFFKNTPIIDFIPKIIPNSNILSKEHLISLESNLPYYHQFKDLKCLYTLTKDGAHLKNLYNKQETAENIIIFFKDSNNNVFGAYANEPLKYNPNSFYGNGECFLFTFYRGKHIHIFPSTQENDYYIHSDYNSLCFGCTAEYFSLYINEDLSKGYSTNTATYRNPILSENIEKLNDKKEYEFNINEVEAFTFV